MDLTFQTNYWFGFPESNSDIILNLTHWQYWWWFWFTYLLCLYYFIFLKLIRSRLLKFHPKIVTSYRAHGKWGDFIICALPISWCINILSNSNFILRMIEWQTESNLFTVRIRGRQWYWVYKIEIKSLLNITQIPKNIGNNYWVLFNKTSLNYSEDYLNILQLKNNNKWLKSYIKTYMFDSRLNKNSTNFNLNYTNMYKTKPISLLTDYLKLKNIFKKKKFSKNSLFIEKNNKYEDMMSRKKQTLHTNNYDIFSQIKEKLTIKFNLLPEPFFTFSKNPFNEFVDKFNIFSKKKNSKIEIIQSNSNEDLLFNFIKKNINSIKTNPFNDFDKNINFIKPNINKNYNIYFNSLKYDDLDRQYRYNYYSTVKPLKIVFNNNILLKFNKNNNIVINKNMPDNIYLVIKQKRYTPVKQLNLFNNKSLILNNHAILELMDINRMKLKKTIKSYKNKPQNFNNVYYRRLLRTKRILVLPTNINITLITNSFDVIHSWYIPGLGIKLDCVPGRSTHHSLFIDHAGFYYGQCAEICGRYHHHMPIRVCALPFEHFLIWWYSYGLPYFNSTKITRKKSISSGLKQFNW